MITTLRNRNFSLLWLAGLISIMGNWMLIVALPFHIYAVTGSALATSAWIMAHILPGVLFGSMAGVFVDRWDRRKTMIAISLLQALTIPFLLLVESQEWIWIVYVVGFLESTLSQFFSPAESALLPTLVGEEHLVSANSLNALNDNIARILGSALGGVLLGAFGLTSVIIADMVSYLIAAFLIALIAVPKVTHALAESETVATAREALSGFWQEWIAGLRLVVKDRTLSSLFVVIGIALFADAILSALLVVWVQGDVGLSATEFGWILTARGIGGVIGGLLVATFGSKFSNRNLIIWGLLWSGAIMLVMVIWPSLPMLVLGVGVVALPAMAWLISAQTTLQQSTADKYRGRVFGAFGTTAALLQLIASGMAGLSADWLGATLLITASAIIYMGSGVLGGILLPNATVKETAVMAD